MGKGWQSAFSAREIVSVFEIATILFGFQTTLHPKFTGADEVISETHEPKRWCESPGGGPSALDWEI